MRKLKLILLVLVICLVAGCNVQERIIFNSEMGGIYESSFDLSPMMTIAAQNGTSPANTKKARIDTLFIFNDILNSLKDSIASLPLKEQESIRDLRNIKLRMVMDEEEGIFNLTTIKEFEEFAEIAFVSQQVDQAFGYAKLKTQNDTFPDAGGDIGKVEKVLFTFYDNTFRRLDEKAQNRLKESESTDFEETQEDAIGEKDMIDAMMGEFDEILKKSVMRLEYTFPKKIKSVSHEEAIISKDGKTVVYEIDWKTLSESKSLLEIFEVVLDE